MYNIILKMLILKPYFEQLFISKLWIWTFPWLSRKLWILPLYSQSFVVHMLGSLVPNIIEFLFYLIIRFPDPPIG